jgi:DNA polymerase epsilon subunit 3
MTSGDIEQEVAAAEEGTEVAEVAVAAREGTDEGRPTEEGEAPAAAAPAAEKSGSKRPRPADSHIADELAFPSSSIARIVKAVLPESMQLAKDARTAFARSASIFALYVTAAANDLCRDAKRATITAQDVYKALDELEFETLTPQVKEFVEMFRATQAAKKGSVGGEGAGGEEADEVTDDEQGARGAEVTVNDE